MDFYHVRFKILLNLTCKRNKFKVKIMVSMNGFRFMTFLNDSELLKGSYICHYVFIKSLDAYQIMFFFSTLCACIFQVNLHNLYRIIMKRVLMILIINLFQLVLNYQKIHSFYCSFIWLKICILISNFKIRVNLYQ